MNRFWFLHALLIISLFFAPLGRAYAETEMETLRKEVRELKKTVNQLTNIVQQQNKRIDQLSGTRAAQSQTPLPSRDGDHPSELSPVETAQPDKKTPPPTAETAPGSEDAEIAGLLDKVNNTPPSPGAQSRSVGLWKYPSPGGTAAKLLPDISLTGTFAAAYFSQDPTGDVGHNPSRTGFNLQEVELALQSVIDPYLRGDVFLSFHEEGVEVEEAYMTTLGAGLPRGMQFKGGKFFIPFGRQNPKHLHNWTFVDNMLVNQYLLGPEGLNELGVELSYLFPVPGFFQAQATFSNGDNEASFGGNRKDDFLYSGRVSGAVDLTEDLTMLMGSSVALGFNSTGRGNHTTLYGGDLYLRWKPSARSSLSWQTEYILRTMQVPGALESDGGLYSYLDWQFLKQFHAGFRYDQMGIPSGIFPKEYRLSPMFSFDPSEFSRIRLQYDYDKISGQEGVHAAFLQFQFTMGPHGAHPF
jgi:hypothetical protein